MTSNALHILSDLDLEGGVEISERLFDELRDRLESAPLSISNPLQQFQPNADRFQERVIFATDPTIRMLAPAGSGKTQTVINRVLRLVRDGMKPERILVLTFDNSATTALRQTLEDAIKALEVAQLPVKVTTLNAFGFEILRTLFPAEYKQVVEARRQHALIRELLAELEKKSKEHFRALPKNVQRRFYLDIFSLLKNALFDPRALEAQKLAEYLLALPSAQPFFVDAPDRAAVRLTVEALVWLYRGYERLLERDRTIDFDDQKLRAYALLAADAEARSRLQSSYSEIIVDEFQDINLLDFELVKLLSAKATLLVTGDDDQSIYGFRGCTPDFIIDLEKHLCRPVESYELQTNYRCPANIVALADKLIRHNTHRVVKTPIAHRQENATVQVVAAQSAGIEAKLIASTIIRLRRSSKLSFNDFAVLYRTNAQSLPLQIEFLLRDIPFHVRKEDNILSNEVLERLIGTLRVKSSLDGEREPRPRDAALLVQGYFLYVPPRSSAALERVFRNASFRSAIDSRELAAALPKSEKSNLAEAAGELLAAQGLVKALDVLASRFRGLQGMIGSVEDVLDQRVPLGEIYSLALSFRGGIAEFADMLETAIERARKQVGASTEAGQVALSTYFRAKGRQWHTVILATCNDGLIPHKRAPVEEERRLMYVALTRTSANLVVSYVKRMCNTKVEASRFLKEAGIL